MSTAEAIIVVERAERKLAQLHLLTLAALRTWHQSLAEAASRLERYGAPGEMKRAKVLKLRFKEMIELRTAQEEETTILNPVPVMSYAEMSMAAE